MTNEIESLMNAGSHKEARKLLDTELTSDADNAGLLHLRGVCNFELGKQYQANGKGSQAKRFLQKAKQDFDGCLDLDDMNDEVGDLLDEVEGMLSGLDVSDTASRTSRTSTSLTQERLGVHSPQAGSSFVPAPSVSGKSTVRGKIIIDDESSSEEEVRQDPRQTMRGKSPLPSGSSAGSAGVNSMKLAKQLRSELESIDALKPHLNDTSIKILQDSSFVVDLEGEVSDATKALHKVFEEMFDEYAGNRSAMSVEIPWVWLNELLDQQSSVAEHFNKHHAVASVQLPTPPPPPPPQIGMNTQRNNDQGKGKQTDAGLARAKLLSEITGGASANASVQLPPPPPPPPPQVGANAQRNNDRGLHKPTDAGLARAKLLAEITGGASVNERPEVRSLSSKRGAEAGPASTTQGIITNPKAYGRKLFSVSKKGNFQAVQELLKNPPSGFYFKGGSTNFALLLSAKFGDIASFKCLLSLGASIETSNDQGYNVIHMAVSENRTEMLRFILSEHKNQIKRTGLLAHSTRRSMSDTSGTGKTPLMMAASCGFYECCQLLCDAGAKVGACAVFGSKTALDCCYESIGRVSDEDREKVQKVLESFGAELGKRDATKVEKMLFGADVVIQDAEEGSSFSFGFRT